MWQMRNGGAAQGHARVMSRGWISNFAPESVFLTTSQPLLHLYMAGLWARAGGDAK